MKRRSFLQTGSAVSLPILVNGLSLGILPKNALFAALNEDSDRVLVLVQLNGGNDGLNTIIPIDQYDHLANARSNILVPENQVLNLQDHVGLHPVMTGLHGLYEDDRLGIVQGVAYPNQNRSHFRSSDIWMTGSPADEFWTSGWLGRYLDKKFPDYPDNYPNPDHPDPFAITIGAIVSETCQGFSSNFSMALTDPFSLSPLDPGEGGSLPDNNYGHELAFLLQTIAQTNAYSDTVLQAAESGTNLSTLYAGDNRLAQQLKTVALLISGGLKTKVYIVSLGGFDTHANQVGDSPTQGQHANLLAQVSGAINAFQDDLKKQGLEEKVLGMTFSEFGRQIRSNDSLGTDHGTAAPLILFGPCVESGILGENPEIGENVEPQEGVAMQYDFRSVYGSVLMDWFGASEADVKELLYEDFQHLPIIAGCSPTSIFDPLIDEDLSVELYPNPCRSYSRIKWQSQGEYFRISVFDHLGHELETLASGNFARGSQELTWDCSGYPPGSYFIRVVGDQGQKTRKLVKL